MTLKQKQALLAYLGYYDGPLDGLWGEKSQRATIDFQRAYMAQTAVDGIFGAATEKRILEVIATGEKPVYKKSDNTDYTNVQNNNTENSTDGNTGTVWDGIKYFKRSEFACKCGKYCNGFPVEPNEKLVETLETIREHFGVPVTVSSGIRCKTHNTNVGGVSKSQHMEGTAADIVVKGVPVSEVVKYAETLMPKTGGIGTYKTFTHIDVRSVKARWNG